MQDISKKRKYVNPYFKAEEVTEAYTLQPGDYVYIKVITPDEKVAALYNLNVGQSSLNNMGEGSSIRFVSYQVSDQGNIDFPYVGKVNVENLTLRQVKENMRDILKNHIDTFSLQVQLTNAQFTILGEVTAPGQYTMSKDQINIFEAIALAGDLTVYGKRRNVQIIRPTARGTKTITVNLRDRNLIDSDKYFIMPNDMVYVEPVKGKMWGFGGTFSLGLFSSIITLILLVNTLN
ncbi:polysaccharide biosynthesis/export family protein [Labilibaculum sp.]|uniref:polysaccharide biosynthesis/export family protein n=1 Tax=Labilibaculum sp. TaxID=2060723 RepID=UPI003567D9F2